jgi:polysaccharide export outer membrane protein
LKFKGIFALYLGKVMVLALCVLATVTAVAQQNTAEVNGGPEPNPSVHVSSSSKKQSNGMAKSSVSQSGMPAVAVDQSYRIGVDDELTISVWHEQDLSGPVAVRPDGVITLPLLNEVRVVGLTTKELQELLADKLRAFVTEPQVTVIVRAIRSRKVYLMGEGVTRPGAYAIGGNTTVLQLLAEAGGLSPYAKAKSIYILRGRDGQHARIPFNYKKAIGDPTSKSDVVLQPGDMIVVP